MADRVPSVLQGLPDDLLDSDRVYLRNLKTHNQDKPDYSKDADDPFPIWGLDEAGFVVMDKDTGDRFQWTGEIWVPTHLRGLLIPVDYDIEVASGNITGSTDVTQEGRSLTVAQGNFQTLWDHEGDKKYFTTGTQLYISSSDATDIGEIRVDGVDINYDFGITSGFLNGHAQVPIPGAFFRVREAFAFSGPALKGDVYIAELGATTNGVPDNPTLVQSKIPLDPSSTGDFASTHTTHNAFFTVFAGFDVHLLSVIPTTAKGDDIRWELRKREFGETGWVSLLTGWSYSGPSPVLSVNKARIQEKADIELRVLSGQPLGQFSAQLQFVLREKTP